jgi:hypothetical protein
VFVLQQNYPFNINLLYFANIPHVFDVQQMMDGLCPFTFQSSYIKKAHCVHKLSSHKSAHIKMQKCGANKIYFIVLCNEIFTYLISSGKLILLTRQLKLPCDTYLNILVVSPFSSLI